MSSSIDVHGAARRSLASVILAAAAITVNHSYVLGPRALALGLALTVVPTGLLLWFRKTRSGVALVGYFLMTLWIVGGFGIYKGLWSGILRLFLGTLLASVSTAFPTPPVGTFPFEASGILMFVAGVFVAFYAVELLRAVLASRPGPGVGPLSGRAWRGVASGSAVAMAALLGAFAVFDRDGWTPPSGGVVTVGVIAPVTGPYALLGTSFVKAVQMAQHDLKGTRYRYRLLIEDSGPDPARARPVVRDVVRRSNAVIGAVSLIGQVTKPYATQARIPHLCVCTVKPIGDGAYNFTNIPSPEAEAERWVVEARRRGFRTVAVIAQDYPSINNHVKALRAEAARQGLSITQDTRFEDTTTDFRAIIATAQAGRPDVYYVEALEPALDRLGQQLRAADVRNLASVVAPSVTTRPDLFEGAWYTDSDLADSTFKTRLQARYPGTQLATHMMPYAYDSFNLIVQAYELGVNPAVYLRSLAGYEGVAGTVTKARGSGNFQSKPAVWEIRDGTPVLMRVAKAGPRLAGR
jgi:ABC-type branched-subunit amino acid transport system substrate-binding protein